MRYGDQPKIAQKIIKLHSQLQQCRDLLGQKTSATLAAKFSQAYREDKSVWGAVSQQIGKTSVRSAITAAQKKYHNEFELQQGMGLWLMSLEDIVQNTHGSFDYLIIDEATQVNLASTIPALNIAENLIVLGDTKQLRHYSFLSNEQEKRIAERLELPEGSYASFRSTSFLDYIDDYLAQIGKMEAITLLDEHYRSAPPLMQFNSDQFYEGNVQVLTGFSSKNRLHALHLDWQMVPGGVWEEKTNVQEANALIVFLQNLIANEKSQSHKTTIGVLSFFSAQAEYLKKNLLTRLSTEEIRQHQIKIGTPFSFQGEERDQMLISCTVDDEVHHGTWNYLNKPDVFNVATSRARRLQTLFLSATPGKLPVSSLLRQYYQFSRPDNLTSEPVTPESWLVELTAKLKQAGFNVEYQHKIADIDIDLILEKNGQMLAVDLIGFPGDVGEAVHLKRYKALFRAGIPLYPLLAVEWLLHQDDSIVDLLNWIRELQSRLSYNAEHLSSISEPSIATGTEELAVLIFPDHLLLLNQLLQAPELNRAVEFNIAAQVTTLSNISQLLAQMFEVTSLSYQRYQASINAAVKKYLDNLITFQMLYKQVWESTGADHSYWNTLIQPIRARHQELTNALAKMLIELQQQIAKSDSEDKLLLDDLDELAERLKNY
ncbi:MAG: DEAD/DEAH box helicase [Reinekea sp.]